MLFQIRFSSKESTKRWADTWRPHVIAELVQVGQFRVQQQKEREDHWLTKVLYINCNLTGRNNTVPITNLSLYVYIILIHMKLTYTICSMFSVFLLD